jgi:cysteine desulfurase
MKPIYLDHHNGAPPFPSAVEKMISSYKEQWGALSAPHQKGEELVGPVNRSLATLYSHFGASEEVYRFLPMANSFEISSELLFSVYLEVTRQTGRNHFLTTALEEAPTLLGMKRIEVLGCIGKRVPLNAHGQVTKEGLEEMVTPRTALLSISWAQGLLGVIHPIEELAQVCREKGILLHVDASYLFGRSFFCLEDLGVDFLSFAGDAFHAPKGVAGLFIKKTFPEGIYRPYTVPGLIGLSDAVENLSARCDYLCTETARLRDKLERGILERYPEARLLFQDVERLPTTSVIAFPGVASDALLYKLNRKALYASLGGGESHQTLFHLLTACGFEPELAHTALSFTLSYETREEEIVAAIEIITDAARQLRTLSEGIA